MKVKDTTKAAGAAVPPPAQPPAVQPAPVAPPPPPPPPPVAEKPKPTPVEATVISEPEMPLVVADNTSHKGVIVAPADLPSYLSGAVWTGEGITPGFENVGASGLSLPMLRVAQPMSPKVVEGKLRAGDLYLSTDPEKAIIPQGAPFEFSLAFHYREWLEWADRDSGLGILNRSKDPRGDVAKACATAFANRGGPKKTRMIGDKTVKVDVFEYHVFFIAGEGDREIMAMPLSRTLFKKGNLLINLARKRIGCPIWTGKYEGRTVLEKNAKGSWYTFEFKTAGWVAPADKEFMEKAFNDAKAMYDNVVLNFAAAEEAAVPTDDGAPGATASGEDVPF